MPSVAEFALELVLGGLLGALGGLFGIGGGLIAIPVLVLFFGLDQQHAQGTALVMVTPNVMIGLWDYARRGSVDRRVAIVLGACAVSFTFVGALYATHVAGPGLRYGFAVFLAAIALVFAVPLGVAIGVYLALLAPGRAGAVIGPLVELLAAIPSVLLPSSTLPHVMKRSRRLPRCSAR